MWPLPHSFISLIIYNISKSIMKESINIVMHVRSFFFIGWMWRISWGKSFTMKNPFGVSMNKSMANQMILYHISGMPITIKSLLTRTPYFISLGSSFKCFIKKIINSMNIFIGGSSEIHPTFISKIHWIFILHDMCKTLKPINSCVQIISQNITTRTFRLIESQTFTSIQQQTITTLIVEQKNIDKLSY